MRLRTNITFVPSKNISENSGASGEQQLRIKHIRYKIGKFKTVNLAKARAVATLFGSYFYFLGTRDMDNISSAFPTGTLTLHPLIVAETSSKKKMLPTLTNFGELTYVKRTGFFEDEQYEEEKSENEPEGEGKGEGRTGSESRVEVEVEVEVKGRGASEIQVEVEVDVLDVVPVVPNFSEIPAIPVTPTLSKVPELPVVPVTPELPRAVSVTPEPAPSVTPRDSTPIRKKFKPLPSVPPLPLNSAIFQKRASMDSASGVSESPKVSKEGSKSGNEERCNLLKEVWRERCNGDTKERGGLKLEITYGDDGGRWREMEGDGGRWREMEGDGGRWREMEGDAGRSRERWRSERVGMN
jgi:hypothetical protein